MAKKKKGKKAKGAKKQKKLLKKQARRAEKRPKGVPKGYHSIQAYLCVDGADRAIEFYKAALGAEVKELIAGPGGKVMHAELVIGDSIFMLGEARPEMGATATKSGFYVYVADCDAAYATAVAAGGKWDPLESTCRHASLSIL